MKNYFPYLLLVTISYAVIISFLFLNKNEEKSLESTKQTFLDLSNYYIGHTQSPINLLTSRAKNEQHSLEIKINDKVKEIENEEHTVKLELEEGNYIESDNKKYEILQIHFHTPSEHHIDGIEYPMEMHIVSAEEGKNKNKKLLVLGVFFKMGKQNEFIEDFIKLIPEKEHDRKVVKEKQFHLKDFFCNEKKSLEKIYHYNGSLTTEPYSECVEWYVLSHVFEASPKEIDRLNKIIGKNDRQIQEKDLLTASFNH
ncbi:MAG: carbonic anhydrase family protein [Flavobacteriales bacterium]|nr:carbonic anhydrase family protein [Flavobacteriales bacterium]